MGAYESVTGSGYSPQQDKNIMFANAVRKLATSYQRTKKLDEVTKLKLQWAEETHKAEMATAIAQIKLLNQKNATLTWQQQQAEKAQIKQERLVGTRRNVASTFQKAFISPYAPGGTGQASEVDLENYNKAFSDFYAQDPEHAKFFGGTMQAMVGAMHSMSAEQRDSLIKSMAAQKEKLGLYQAKQDIDKTQLGIITQEEASIQQATKDARSALAAENGLGTAAEINTEANQRIMGEKAQLSVTMARITPIIQTIQDARLRDTMEQSAEQFSKLLSSNAPEDTAGITSTAANLTAMDSQVKQSLAPDQQRVWSALLDQIKTRYNNISATNLQRQQLIAKTNTFNDIVSLIVNRAMRDDKMGQSEAVQFARKRTSSLVRMSTAIQQEINSSADMYNKLSPQDIPDAYAAATRHYIEDNRVSGDMKEYLKDIMTRAALNKADAFRNIK